MCKKGDRVIESSINTHSRSPLRHETYRRLHCRRAGAVGGFFDAFENPIEHANILSEAWPEEIAVSVFAEPVHLQKGGEEMHLSSKCV